MNIENRVEEVATIKQPQFKASKHAHLWNVYNNCLECEHKERILRKIEVCEGLQYINDCSGDYIQSILWLDNCENILEGLQEVIQDNEKPDKLVLYKDQQVTVIYLQEFMIEHDLDFIFI